MKTETKANVFKFRAEYQADVIELIKLIPPRAILGAEWKTRWEHDLPDADATITTTLTISTLRQLMSKVPDGHVMVETVSTPETYTGERGYPDV